MTNNLTWHCNIVLQNDEECAGVMDCLTTHVMSRVYHRYDGKAYANQMPIRICVLAQFVRMYVEELVDADNEHGDHNQMTEELICGALQEISFKEIAEDLIGDYSPKSPAEVAEAEEYFEVMGFGNYDVNED